MSDYFHNIPLLVPVKDAQEINSLISSIKNGLEKVHSNDFHKNDYFELIFVGDHESIKKDEKFAHIKHNYNVKFEMLPSDLGQGKIELPNNLQKKIDKLNLYYKKHRPLTYNGTPKPGAYFDSNLRINKKIGKHRLGIIYGKKKDEVKKEIIKLYNHGFGVKEFFKISIHASGGYVFHPEEDED